MLINTMPSVFEHRCARGRAHSADSLLVFHFEAGSLRSLHGAGAYFSGWLQLAARVA